MNKKGWKTEISKAITDSTHAKRREGWKRERNRAIDTGSTHLKRRRQRGREKETELYT